MVCGSAIEIILIANRPLLTQKNGARHRRYLFPAAAQPAGVLGSLGMLYEIFSYLPRARVMALESAVDEPQSSSIFSRYPELLGDRTTLGSVADAGDRRHYADQTRSPDGSGHRNPAARTSRAGRRPEPVTEEDSHERTD